MVMISTVDHFRIRKTVNPTDHSLCDQLPVGLLAQLVKQCTGIAQVMGSNSVKTRFFLSHIFTTAQEDCFHILKEEDRGRKGRRYKFSLDFLEETCTNPLPYVSTGWLPYSEKG